MDQRLVVLCLAICVSFGSAPTEALDCYECNVHLCNRDESGLPESQRRQSPECEKFREAMALTNQTARTQALEAVNEAYPTCEPVIRGNCLACIKVDTTVSYVGSRGKQHYDKVISMVCAKEPPHTEDDDCDYRGPKYARSIVCVCYGDNCNGATALTGGLTALAALVLGRLL